MTFNTADQLVKTSYSSSDVKILLKDLSSEMKELSTEEREKLIQSGVHYSEMLPEEHEPSAEYSKLYNKALDNNKTEIAEAVARVAEMMVKQCGKEPIIVSLARAGIPIGVLIKRYIKYKYKTDCPHYAISIIRDKGIDENAINYIYAVEVMTGHNKVKNICFVDGWTGKGVINRQLIEAVDKLKKQYGYLKDLRSDLYVLADPANVTPYCGTREDYLLPSACLNSTVSGLVSRTILNKYINDNDFHGAVYFKKFENIDKTNAFVNAISDRFAFIDTTKFTGDVIPITDGWAGMDIVTKICEQYDIADYKKVKPGIGETTRVLLRRVPWKILVNTDADIMKDPDIAHIGVLCAEKHISIEYCDLGHYKVCGIIKELSADA